jgi:transposase
MFIMEVPRGADGQPVLPEATWEATPAATQAVLAALAQQVVALAAEVRDLQARLGQNATNSSRPPSSDPPQTPRQPPAPPTGRARGAQPGHVAHQRALVPPERVDHFVPHWPAQCARHSITASAPEKARRSISHCSMPVCG